MTFSFEIFTLFFLNFVLNHTGNTKFSSVIFLIFQFRINDQLYPMIFDPDEYNRKYA